MCWSAMAPQEGELISLVTERFDGVMPQYSRLGMWAVAIAPRDARCIRGALMRHHCIVPRRQTLGESESVRSTNGISDRFVDVHLILSKKRTTRRHVPPARSPAAGASAQLCARNRTPVQPLLS
jgi:hypothetical protein